MIWKFTKTLFFFLFYIFCCSTSNAQQLNIKNFSIEDGLPQSQIIDICQDHTGAIWFSTNGGGVSQFDGTIFHNYSTKEGLGNNRTYDLLEDKNQTLWIGTAKGLNKYFNNKLYKVNDTLINQLSIYRIQEHSNGEIWFGTNNGIYIYDGQKFKPFVRNDSLGRYQVWAIEQDKLGNTWIGTLLNGVFYYDGKNIIHFTKKDGLNDMKNRDILINGDKVWVSTYHGVNVFDLSKMYDGNRKFDTLKINKKPFLECSYRFFKDSSGVVWVGTSSGVSKITYGKYRNIRKENGLCENQIVAITQDKEGNMWFGSFSSGVSKYRNDLFVNINERQGLASNSVFSFLKDSKNNMWIGTWGGGVSKLNYDAWQNKDTISIENYTNKDGLPYNNIWSMCEDKKGNIWFGTSASGVSVYDGKNFKNYFLKDGLHGLRIQCVLADKKGNVWLANENGVDKYDGEKFTFYGEGQGFSSQGVSCIYEDNTGTLWFGSPDKIIKYDGKLFTTILRPEGFPHIKNIIKDKFGLIWFSTDAGIVVYTGRAFKTISVTDGLSSNTIYYVKSDADGNLWIGTNNGIDKLDLGKFINQKEIVIKHYGKEEGFIGVECNQNAFYKDGDGKLWIGTVDGVTIYDPSQERKNTEEPKTEITNIRLFLQNTDFVSFCDSLKNGLPENLKLPYDKNYITFNFIGISQTIPNKVKYQFKLEGSDADWLPEGKETSATYSNLAPGKYTFKVKSANEDNIWNEEPVSFSFEIVPPIWKQTWFFILIALGAVFLIYSVIRIRERRLKYSQRILERQVAIRTKELFEEKEKLQIAYSEIDEKNKDITDSIYYAKRIQDAILPSDVLVKQLLPDSFILFKPKDIVSGDFYWLEKWGNKTLIAAVDCTGHGVPGSFMSIVGHNLLAQNVNVLGLSTPSLILNETNKQLAKKLNQNSSEAIVRDGMDIALCAINYSKSTMEFSGANNPVWIIRNNEVVEINGNKFPIGAYISEELQLFTNHQWELQKDDCIYIFTDGYVDQFGGPKGKKFKYKQLKELLLANNEKPMDEQKSILEKTINEWRGNLEQVDDMLIIGIRI